MSKSSALNGAAVDLRRKSVSISKRLSKLGSEQTVAGLGHASVSGTPMVQIVKPVPLPPDAGMEKPKGWDKLVIHPGG